MATSPRYGEILHSGTSKQWKRNCDTLCQCDSIPCRQWSNAGSSGTLGRWGKRIKARMDNLFDHSLPKSRSKVTDHVKNVNAIKNARKRMTSASHSPKDQVGFPVQAHHLLSSSVIFGEPSFKECAMAAAYDVNNGWNCILLPSNFGRQKWDDLQRHLGNHDDEEYYSKVDQEISDVIQGVKAADYCDEAKMKDLHKKFHAAEEKIFKKFKKNKIWLYDYAQEAYDNDYRSELGNSKGKFEEWDGQRQKRAGAVDNTFYTSRKYPIP